MVVVVMWTSASVVFCWSVLKVRCFQEKLSFSESLDLKNTRVLGYWLVW